MPFEPGQSGNPGGRRKERPFRDALMLALKEPEDIPADDPATARNKLRAVASQLVQKAVDGDVGAIREIGDRVDGKVAQALIGGDDDEPPLRTVSRIELVDLAGSTSSAPPQT